MGLICWEAHAHTSECSPCGQVPAKTLAEWYIQEGYGGVIVTNHLSDYGFSYVREKSWQEQVLWYYNGYQMVRDAAGDRMQVLFGAEINFRGDPNDYLVYGMTVEWLLAHPELLDMGVRAFSEEARRNGWLLYQAHPFRNNMRIVEPALLDGIEVFNGNMRHDSRNFIAAQWAARYGLLTIGGSDFHEEEDTARGGFFTGCDITDNRTLIEALRQPVIIKTSAEKFGL